MPDGMAASATFSQALYVAVLKRPPRATLRNRLLTERANGRIEEKEFTYT